MADTRLLHKHGMHGDRIVALDDLSFRVWAQYVLSADDYGVMRESPSVLAADNRRLEREPVKRLRDAMQAVLTVGLVAVFVNQDTRYWWQTDWQDFQMVKRPRITTMPAPSREELRKATPKTARLFTEWHRFFVGNVSETLAAELAKVQEGKSTLARELQLQPEQQPQPQPEPERKPRALARVEVEPAWGHGRPGASAGRGSLVGDHRRCNDAAAAACERGFCVPSWVVANWLAQLGNGPEARAEVAATVEHGLAALGPGAIGDDPKKYWPNFWTMRHGTRMTDAPKGDVFRDVARELDALEAQRGRH